MKKIHVFITTFFHLKPNRSIISRVSEYITISEPHSLRIFFTRQQIYLNGNSPLDSYTITLSRTSIHVLLKIKVGTSVYHIHAGYNLN